MKIASYNSHRSAPFLRALVERTTKFTRSKGADAVIPSASLPASYERKSHQGHMRRRTNWHDKAQVVRTAGVPPALTAANLEQGHKSRADLAAQPHSH